MALVNALRSEQVLPSNMSTGPWIPWTNHSPFGSFPRYHVNWHAFHSPIDTKGTRERLVEAVRDRQHEAARIVHRSAGQAEEVVCLIEETFVEHDSPVSMAGVVVIPVPKLLEGAEKPHFF